MHLRQHEKAAKHIRALVSTAQLGQAGDAHPCDGCTISTGTSSTALLGKLAESFDRSFPHMWSYRGCVVKQIKRDGQGTGYVIQSQLCAEKPNRRQGLLGCCSDCGAVANSREFAKQVVRVNVRLDLLEYHALLVRGAESEQARFAAEVMPQRDYVKLGFGGAVLAGLAMSEQQLREDLPSDFLSIPLRMRTEATKQLIEFSLRPLLVQTPNADPEAKATHALA